MTILQEMNYLHQFLKRVAVRVRKILHYLKNHFYPAPSFMRPVYVFFPRYQQENVTRHAVNAVRSLDPKAKVAVFWPEGFKITECPKVDYHRQVKPYTITRLLEALQEAADVTKADYVIKCTALTLPTAPAAPPPGEHEAEFVGDAKSLKNQTGFHPGMYVLTRSALEYLVRANKARQIPQDRESYEKDGFVLPRLLDMGNISYKLNSWKDGFLNGWSYTLADDYDFNRFRKTRAVTFAVTTPPGANIGHAMRMLGTFVTEGKPFNWKQVYRSSLEREIARMVKAGKRMEPLFPSISVKRAVTVADIGVMDDMERLIPTWVYHHPEVPLHVYCDQATASFVQQIMKENFITSSQVILEPYLTKEMLAMAESRLSNLTVQDAYWKPGPIWWKLEALRRVLREYGEPTLLVDSDIVFTGAVTEEFEDVDVVLSPFYWPDPLCNVKKHPDTNEKVHIAQRDGWYNAGFALVARPEVAELWLDLYEAGVGGFYEQWIMGFFPQRFRTHVFGPEHNWGQWRQESPRHTVKSVHVHSFTVLKSEWGRDIQRIANEATQEATKKLQSRKDPYDMA